jgi:hypothetical protein
VSKAGSIDVALGSNDDLPYIEFDASGRRIGRVAYGGDDFFQPQSDLRWEVYQDEVHLHDASGAELKKLRRTPQNRWISMARGASCAADGSLVVQSGSALHEFSPQGEPIASVEVPPVAFWRNLAFAKNPRALVFTASGAIVWCIDLASGEVLKTRVGAELGDGDATRAFWSIADRELWILDLTAKKVLRYRVKL